MTRPTRANSLSRKVMSELPDFVYDIRLARRWKRRCSTDNYFKNKCYSDTINITLDEVEKREGIVDEDYAVYLNTFRECNEDNSVDDDDMDPQYGMFLKQLREDGKSYVLEFSIDDEMSMFIKYEEDDGLDNVFKRKDSRIWKNVTSGEKMGTLNDLGNVPSREKIETPESLRVVSSNERKRSVVEKNLRPKLPHLVSCGTRGRPRQKSGPKAVSSPNPESTNKTDYDTVDESYQVFLNSLKQDGVILVFTTEDGKRCKYEEDDENSSDSDSEIVATDSAPSCIGSPTQSNRSLFREKLMIVLSMPYDQKEFDELMREASERKPLERHRDLRGRTISYSMDKSVTKSYLDHYTGLAKKIDSVRCDCPRVLNLLRGFFYWLKNLSHKGAFPPWLDGLCLNAMPQNLMKKTQMVGSLKG